MTRQPLTMIANESNGRKMYAIVPEEPEAALDRLRRWQGPHWERENCEVLWHHEVDVEQSRLRMRNFTKFWLA